MHPWKRTERFVQLLRMLTPARIMSEFFESWGNYFLSRADLHPTFVCFVCINGRASNWVTPVKNPKGCVFVWKIVFTKLYFLWEQHGRDKNLVVRSRSVALVRFECLCGENVHELTCRTEYCCHSRIAQIRNDSVVQHLYGTVYEMTRHIIHITL